MLWSICMIQTFPISKKKDLEALESAMEKLNIEFTSYIDFYYMQDGSKQY